LTLTQVIPAEGLQENLIVNFQRNSSGNLHGNLEWRISRDFLAGTFLAKTQLEISLESFLSEVFNQFSVEFFT
jgi:hypothetical protein